MKLLQDALDTFGIPLPSEQTARLDKYRQLLWDWNQKLNLTRHTDYETFVARDLVDSIQVARLIAENEEVLDVGSGGGVPGIVLGILRPDLQLTLCESVRKKATVLQSMVEALELPLAVHGCRAESLLEDFRFETLTARAVGPLWKLLKWFQPHWASIDRCLAIKGPRWVEERGAARHRGFLRNLELRCAATYETPGSGAQNFILQIRPSGRNAPEARR
jgi:16S rRNA (guanine527-N7)-methyltransferase